jgi:hypothetical protein
MRAPMFQADCAFQLPPIRADIKRVKLISVNRDS